MVKLLKMIFREAMDCSKKQSEFINQLRISNYELRIEDIKNEKHNKNSFIQNKQVRKG